MTYAAERHPWCLAAQAIAGRKISWLVALAAEKTPMTRPRWGGKPPVGDDGAEDEASGAGADADDEAPEQPELPRAVMKVVARLASPTRSRDRWTTRRGPEALHHRGSKWRARP